MASWEPVLVFEGAASVEVACDASVWVHESSSEHQAGLTGKQEETHIPAKRAPDPGRYIRGWGPTLHIWGICNCGCACTSRMRHVLSIVNLCADQLERRNGIWLCVPMFYVVLIVLCGGIVKSSVLSVAACVAGHPSVLGVCVCVCISVHPWNMPSTCY